MDASMSDLPKARRTDGTDYKPTHPQYMGCGIMRSCGRCGKHRAQGPGWRKTAYGMTCSVCLTPKEQA